MFLRRKQVKGNKAQALIELAVFGAIAMACLSLLIRHIMHANLNQSESMRTFRKAAALSRNQGMQGETGELSVVSLQDKIVPSAEDHFGAGSRTPIGTFASVSISQDLYGQYDYNESHLQYGIPEESLPAVYIDINNLAYLDRADAFLQEYDINANRYLTSFWEVIDLREGYAYIGSAMLPAPRERKVIDFDEDDEFIEDVDWERDTRHCWYWEELTWDKVMDKGSGSFDLDGDGVMETIIGKTGSVFSGTILILDPNKGEIHQEYTSKDFMEGKQREGLSMDMRISKQDDNTITKSKGRQDFDIDSRQVTERKIYVRTPIHGHGISLPMDEEVYESEANTQRHETWVTE